MRKEIETRLFHISSKIKEVINMTNTNAKTYSNGKYTEYFNPKYGTYEEYVEMLRNTLYSWGSSLVTHNSEYDDREEYSRYHRYIEETNFDE